MNQFERVAVCLRAFVSEGEEIGREVGNDPIDDPIARRLFAQVQRQLAYLAADRGNRQRRLLEGNTLDDVFQLARNLAVLDGVCPLLSRQGTQPKLPIQRHPTLRGSE